MSKIKRLPVRGYEGLYEVDYNGNIYSIKRAGTKGKLLVSKPDSFGYLRAGLSKGNVCKTYKSHRIVASAFIPNPENLPQVNHKDGDKTNNCVSNLEWVTSQTNIRHAWGLGLSKPLSGDKNGCSKITDKQRIDIVKEYALSASSQKEICRKYGVSQGTISLLIKSFLRAHFSGQAIDKNFKP